jgi:hypothetical protein
VDHFVVLGEAHLRRILQIIGQGCAGLSPGSADRKHQFTPNPWRTSSPLRPRLGFRHTQGRNHHVTCDPRRASSSLRSGLSFRYTQDIASWSYAIPCRRYRTKVIKFARNYC